MSIGISPFTPTPLDRGDDKHGRDPKQPPLDKRGEPQVEDEDEPAEGNAPDALERAVPPVPQTR